MTSFRALWFSLLAALSVISTSARSQDSTAARHRVVPLSKMQPEQWTTIVSGDPTKSGEIFVMRIHNDAGYIVFPHVHPMDEHSTVVQGSWSLGMGPRFDRSALRPVETGDYALVPKTMAHFAWSKTETIVQVHGIGPFNSTLVDPVYELTDKGVVVLTSLLQPGRPTSSSPPDCFALAIGTQVRGDAGKGTVVGARCSPANQITEYWVRRANGERFWATLPQLKRR